MKKQLIKNTVLVLSLLILSACGRNISGTYQGTEILTGNNLGVSQGSNLTNNNVIVVLTEQNGTVSGNVTSPYGVSGTLSAQYDGTNLSSVNVISQSSSASTYGSYNYVASCLQSQSLTGNLMISGDSSTDLSLTGQMFAQTNCGIVYVQYSLKKLATN